MNTANSPVSAMDSIIHMLGQGVLQKHISKEPSNISLMCSPFFGQVALQKDKQGAK